MIFPGLEFLWRTFAEDATSEASSSASAGVAGIAATECTTFAAAVGSTSAGAGAWTVSPDFLRKKTPAKTLRLFLVGTGSLIESSCRKATGNCHLTIQPRNIPWNFHVKKTQQQPPTALSKNQHGLHGWCDDPLAALGGQIHEAPLPSCQRMLEICEFLASFEASCVETIFFLSNWSGLSFLNWQVMQVSAQHFWQFLEGSSAIREEATEEIMFVSRDNQENVVNLDHKTFWQAWKWNTRSPGVFFVVWRFCAFWALVCSFDLFSDISHTIWHIWVALQSWLTRFCTFILWTKEMTENEGWVVSMIVAFAHPT